MSAKQVSVIQLTSDAELRLALMRARELQRARTGTPNWLERVNLQRAIVEFMDQRRVPGADMPSRTVLKST